MIRESLLKLDNISVRYDGVRALDGASIAVDEGEIVALMGPNGAGKSTVLKAIFGLAPIESGTVLWHERPLAPVAHEVVQLGIAFVPQGRRVFTHLTVQENLEVGGYVINNRREVRRRISEAMELFPALGRKRYVQSGALSGGEQQMLALARGLMVDPRLLLLDEPSLGLAPKIVREVFRAIKEINDRHKTAIMVVEHNIRSLLEIAHRAYVLDKGRIAYAGAPAGVRSGDVLERAFLGS